MGEEQPQPGRLTGSSPVPIVQRTDHHRLLTAELSPVHGTFRRALHLFTSAFHLHPYMVY